MSATKEDLIAQAAVRNKHLASNRAFESTLIPGLAENDIMRTVFLRLRTASVPKNVGNSRRHVSETIDPFEVKFYAKKAEDFVDEWGEIDDAKALDSARAFRFEGPVTVTRQKQIGGHFFYRLSDGVRSLSIGERGTQTKGFTHTVLQASGFAGPTGRAAGYRTRGRSPRTGPE